MKSAKALKALLAMLLAALLIAATAMPAGASLFGKTGFKDCFFPLSNKMLGDAPTETAKNTMGFFYFLFCLFIIDGLLTLAMLSGYLLLFGWVWM